MRKSSLLILLATIFLIIGCTPTEVGTELTVPEVSSSDTSVEKGEAEDSAGPVISQASGETSEQALTPIDAEDGEERIPESGDSEDSAGPVIEPADRDETSMDETSEDTTSEVAEPVTVNLSELTPEPATDTEPREMPMPGGMNPDERLAWETAQDLAQRLGIDVSEVTIISIEEKQWSDSSLGCPADGASYMMVLTEGYLITLSAEGQEYTYHTNTTDRYFQCGADGKPVP